MIYIKDKENASIFDEAPDSQMDETLGMIRQFNSFTHSFSQSITTNCMPVPTMPSTVLNVIPELTICYALEDFCIQLTHTTIPMW